MNLQFYETIQDKSKEYITYLIENILPKFTTGELNYFLEDLGNNSNKNSKGSKGPKSKSGIEFNLIGNDSEKLADLSKLDESQRKILFQIFISRELNNKLAVKWRFYQYIKYHLELNIKTVKVNKGLEHSIDFILDTNEKENIIVSCHDILELSSFKSSLNEIDELVKEENLNPDRILFSAGKSFRNIPIDEPIKINNTEIIPELWIEWIEENLSFGREDLLIINNSELKLAGFNFTSSEDLLNYVYQNSKGGQISIFKQSDFFTEAFDDNSEIELVWKGIMMK
ncbi:MAG: hypothetical protein ACFE8B_02850 [Candidatus Hermodarchaeota archaeon]